jgi:hypothetical protein
MLHGYLRLIRKDYIFPGCIRHIYCLHVAQLAMISRWLNDEGDWFRWVTLVVHSFRRKSFRLLDSIQLRTTICPIFMCLNIIQDLTLARIITSQHTAIHAPRWAQTHWICTWRFHKIIEYEDCHTKSALVPFTSCHDKVVTIHPCITTQNPAASRPCYVELSSLWLVVRQVAATLYHMITLFVKQVSPS